MHIMGSLNVLEGTMNAEMYIKVLEQICSPPDDIYFSRTMQTTFCSYYKSMARVEESGC